MSWWRNSARPNRLLATSAALAAVLALAAAPASARTLVPPKPGVFWGVSDRGSVTEFNEFAGLLSKHPALLETFHPWGNSLNKAYERWRETGTRPIIHISTIDDQKLTEMITPAQIALGGGDDYLLQLNDFLAKKGVLAYLRPLGEPNRCLNAWSAVYCDGSQTGGEHTTGRRARPRPSAAPCGGPRRESRATAPATTGRAAAGSTGRAPTSTRSIRSGGTSTASTPASSGKASRSRSPSGRSTGRTNRASSNSSWPGRRNGLGCGCSSTTPASAPATTPTTSTSTPAPPTPSGSSCAARTSSNTPNTTPAPWRHSRRNRNRHHRHRSPKPGNLSRRLSVRDWRAPRQAGQERKRPR